MSARAARAALGLLALSLLWGCAARWRDTSLPWTATGAERLAVFAAAYVALAGLAWRIAPRRWTALLTVCGLAYAAWWVGVGALAAVLLFALAAYLAGRRLTGREDLLAWIVGVGCYSWLAGVLAFLPVNGPWLHAALHLLPVLADWRAAGRLMRRLAAPAHAGPGWLHPAFGFVLLAHLLVVLKPEAGPDALSMHLVVPATVDWRGFWPFDVREFLWAVMPMGANWAFTTVYLIGGEAGLPAAELRLLSRPASTNVRDRGAVGEPAPRRSGHPAAGDHAPDAIGDRLAVCGKLLGADAARHDRGGLARARGRRLADLRLAGGLRAGRENGEPAAGASGAGDVCAATPRMGKRRGMLHGYRQRALPQRVVENRQPGVSVREHFVPLAPVRPAPAGGRPLHRGPDLGHAVPLDVLDQPLF